MRPLRSEQEIMSSWKGDPSQPLVSVCCITYNHEPYIEDALEGFLIQETDFPFEILIHDDASTDRTADIIREYESKYPNLIKAIYQKENQYSKGIKPNQKFNFPRASGQYIALCEGDDFWVDKEKLSLQVNILKNRNDISFCFHNAKIVLNKFKTDKIFCNLDKIEFSIDDVISKNWFVPTQSIMFPKELLTIGPWINFVKTGDLALQLILSNKSNFYYIDKIMSCYRKHENGVTFKKTRAYFNNCIIECLNYFNMYSNFKYDEMIKKRTLILANDISCSKKSKLKKNFIKFYLFSIKMRSLMK